MDTRNEIREFLTSLEDWERVATDAVAILRSEAGRNSQPTTA